MIAYKAICIFNQDQIIQGNYNEKYNGKPFVTITEFDKYIAIYSLMFPKEYTRGRNDQEKQEIAIRIQKIWSMLTNINPFSQMLFMICDIHNKIGKLDTHEEYWIVIASRSIQIISKNMQLMKHANIWIRTDTLYPLRELDYKSYENVLIVRCEMLYTCAPEYWKNVASLLYKDVVYKNIDIINPKMDRTLLNRYIKLFPNLFSKEIVNMSALEYNIKKLPDNYSSICIRIFYTSLYP